MIKVATTVQQITTELNGALFEEEEIVAINNIVLNLRKKMTTRVHRLLKAVAFSVNGIVMQRYELSSALQEQRIDLALLAKTHLRRHERFYIPNYQVYRNDRFPGIKGGTAVAVKKRHPPYPCRPTSSRFNSHRDFHTDWQY
jgi:hypothetical protein